MNKETTDFIKQIMTDYLSLEKSYSLIYGLLIAVLVGNHQGSVTVQLEDFDYSSLDLAEWNVDFDTGESSIAVTVTKNGS